VTRDQLEQRIRDLLDEHLCSEGGEMTLPLKPHEVGNLAGAIRHLTLDAARDGVR
jgi:hypothetical protein